jgi:ubiquinone/menaquinone biosynthesis C-methylase UbiE
LQFVAQKDVIAAMDEIYRVLVPGGWACISVPSTDGQGAFAPHHKSYWNSYTFAFFTDYEYARQLGEPTKFRFQRVRCFDAYPGKKFEIASVKYTYADLCAIKGQRQPGLVNI